MPSENAPSHEDTHSAIEEMIASPPGCLLHSGISILAVVVAVFLGLSALVKYPDKIVANGILTSDNPPIAHINAIGGVIDSLYVSDGEEVEVGKKLAYIENVMDRDDLIKLEKFILKYGKIDHIPKLKKLKIPDQLQLGDLTKEYARLQLLYAEFQSVLRQPFVFRQIKTLKKELGRNKELQTTLIDERKFSAEELALIKKDIRRDSFLLQEGAISQVEKETKEGELLRYKKQYNNLNVGLIQNQIQQEKLNLEIGQLTKERASQVNQYRFAIQEVINQIQQKIVKWEKNHYIKAKISGRTVIPSNIHQERFVAPNTEILAIIPQSANDEKYALVKTPPQGIGKIEEGDKVILKIDGYPYKEFGLLTSKVEKVSFLPQKNQEGKPEYEIRIPVSNILVTNFNKEIAWKPQLGITAEIITKEKTILERVTEPFLNLLISQDHLEGDF